MNADEFKQTFLPLHARLYRAAYALLGNAEDAEDMVQETYLKLWQKRDELDIRTNVPAYCVATVRNLCFNLMQTKRYQSEEPMPEHLDRRGTDNPELQLERRDEQAQLKALITGLPPQQRKVLWLRDVNECSFEEIEQATGLNAVNIRVTLSRARQRIREQIKRITGKAKGQ